MPFSDAAVFSRAQRILENAPLFPVKLNAGEGGVLAEAARLMYLGYRNESGSPDTYEAFTILTQVAARRGPGVDSEEFWESVEDAYWTLGTVCHSKGRPSIKSVIAAATLCRDVSFWIEDSMTDTIMPAHLRA